MALLSSIGAALSGKATATVGAAVLMVGGGVALAQGGVGNSSVDEDVVELAQNDDPETLAEECEGNEELQPLCDGPSPDHEERNGDEPNGEENGENGENGDVEEVTDDDEGNDVVVLCIEDEDGNLTEAEATEDEDTDLDVAGVVIGDDCVSFEDMSTSQRVHFALTGDPNIQPGDPEFGQRVSQLARERGGHGPIVSGAARGDDDWFRGIFGDDAEDNGESEESEESETNGNGNGGNGNGGNTNGNGNGGNGNGNGPGAAGAGKPDHVGPPEGVPAGPPAGVPAGGPNR